MIYRNLPPRPLQSLFLGIGLLWIGLFSILGSLLGAQMAFRIQQDPQWINSWQHLLIRSAHSHMNSCGLLCCILGLAYPHALRACPGAWIPRCYSLFLLSVPLFGLGILAEAFFPVTEGYVWPMVCSALGGGGFITSLVGIGGALVNAHRRFF